MSRENTPQSQGSARERARAKLAAQPPTSAWGYFGGCSTFLPSTPKTPQSRTRSAPIVKRPTNASGARNISSSSSKVGRGTDGYFSYSDSLAVGDLYVDPGKRKKKDVAVLIPFKAPHGKALAGPNALGYDYIPQGDGGGDRKNMRKNCSDGSLPNMSTNPMRKGIAGSLTQKATLFGWGDDRRFPEYMSEDYDAPHQLKLKELDEHRAKMKGPFVGADYGNVDFNQGADIGLCSTSVDSTAAASPSNRTA